MTIITLIAIASCTWKGTQYLKSECFYGYKTCQYAVLVILLQLIQLSQLVSHTTTVAKKCNSLFL